MPIYTSDAWRKCIVLRAHFKPSRTVQVCLERLQEFFCMFCIAFLFLFVYLKLSIAFLFVILADTSVISVISPTPSFSLQYPFRASSRPPRLRQSNLKFCDIRSSEGTLRLRLCCNRKRRRPPHYTERRQLKILESEKSVSSAVGFIESGLISKNEQRCETCQYERLQRSVLSLHVRSR